MTNKKTIFLAFFLPIFVLSSCGGPVSQDLAIAHFVLGKNPQLQDVMEQKSPHLVFFSTSDGKSSAHVVWGTGSTLHEALSSTADKLGDTAEQAHWFKVDIVNEYNTISNPDFDAPLAYDRSLNGLAFASNSENNFPDNIAAAFLPEELVSKTLLDSDNKVLFRNIEKYTHSTTESPSSLPQSSLLYTFKTKSFFFERPNFGESVSTVSLFRGHQIYDNVTPEVLLESSINAGNYLIGATQENGKFIYTYLPKTDSEKDDYNILRHAGTIYAMTELYEHIRQPELLDAISRSLEYLQSTVQSCFGSAGEQEVLCVVEENETKVGANGLAILAIAKYTKVTGDKTYVPIADGLARWLGAIQEEDGDFNFHKRNNATGQIDTFISGYYPGEAIFGLVRLYEIDGNREWLDIAEKQVKYLITVRDKGLQPSELEHDHWLLYGLNALYQSRPDALYIEHTKKLTRAIVDGQSTKDDDDPNNDKADWEGSYDSPPRSTPAATRTEGLLAAYSLLKKTGNEKEANEALQAADFGIRFQLQTQFDAASAMYLEDPQRSLGGFHESLTDFTIRIDYIQHNISSFLARYDLLISPL